MITLIANTVEKRLDENLRDCFVVRIVCTMATRSNNIAKKNIADLYNDNLIDENKDRNALHSRGELDYAES